MNQTPTLPGMESAIAEMERAAITDEEVERLPTFTGERVAIYEPKRYELAARLLFAENISRRTICKWLHMSPNTLSAIETREIRLHPESVEALKDEAKAELEQLKRLGRQALRERFFDKKELERTSLKELASTLKLIDEMSKECYVKSTNRNTKDNTENEYIEIIENNGFGGEKNSAQQTGDRNEIAAPENCETRPYQAHTRPESERKDAESACGGTQDGEGRKGVENNSTLSGTSIKTA